LINWSQFLSHTRTLCFPTLRHLSGNNPTFLSLFHFHFFDCFFFWFLTKNLKKNTDMIVNTFVFCSHVRFFSEHSQMNCYKSFPIFHNGDLCTLYKMSKVAFQRSLLSVTIKKLYPFFSFLLTLFISYYCKWLTFPVFFHFWTLQRVFDCVSLMPLSSGFCLGSANWLIQSDYDRVLQFRSLRLFFTLTISYLTIVWDCFCIEFFSEW
jgi:hypothetical protein